MQSYFDNVTRLRCATIRRLNVSRYFIKVPLPELPLFRTFITQRLRTRHDSCCLGNTDNGAHLLGRVTTNQQSHITDNGGGDDSSFSTSGAVRLHANRTTICSTHLEQLHVRLHQVTRYEYIIKWSTYEDLYDPGTNDTGTCHWLLGQNYVKTFKFSVLSPAWAYKNYRALSSDLKLQKPKKTSVFSAKCFSCKFKTWS